MASVATLDRTRVRELTEREEQRLNEQTAGSGRMFERARLTLTGGVASSYQLHDPWPIYLERGEGQWVWDVDGNRLRDFHNAFGSMVQGHAHPAIVRAVRERAALGTHFAAPTEDGVVVAEELSRRFSRSIFTLQKQLGIIFGSLGVKSRLDLRKELHNRGLL